MAKSLYSYIKDIEHGYVDVCSLGNYEIIVSIEKENGINNTIQDISAYCMAGYVLTSVMLEQLAACICAIMAIHHGEGKVVSIAEWNSSTCVLSEYVVQNIGGGLDKSCIEGELFSLDIANISLFEHN